MVELLVTSQNFLAGESRPCILPKEGIKALLDTLTFLPGQGREEDLLYLEEISHTMQDASLCALGRTAANPVLSTLRYFKDEHLAPYP